MFLSVLLLLSFTTLAAAQEQPRQILQIYRDFLKPGSEDAYSKIEQDAARICAEMKCPHPYLAIESLTGPKEVWFLNGYVSIEEQKQVVEAYGKNPQLLQELAKITERKKDLISDPIEAFAHYLPSSIHLAPAWTLGRGRFLVVTVTTNSEVHVEGSVFGTEDRARFIIRAAQTRGEALAWAAVPGIEARAFAVRPDWSLPAQDWIASDPHFWQRSK
jgi:hypothetical protein